MEKSNRAVNASWFGLKDGEGEIVDAEVLVDLLETYRFGKDNVPIGRFRFKAAATVPEPEPDNTTEIEEEDDGDRSEDPIILEATVSETGSNNETGHNWLESSSANLPNVENEREQNAEDCEEEEEEEEEEIVEVVVEEDEGEEEEEEEIEVVIEDDDEGEEDKKSERSSLESEKSNLETLLATQENYEFYCPSCSSCITRKVILKTRERGKHVDLSPDLKLDVRVDEPDEPSDIEKMEPPVKVHVLPETRIEGDDQENKDEGSIFTCLACLKYFIRLGARFLQLDYIRGKPVEEPDLTQQKQSKPPDVSRESKPVEVTYEAMNSINTTQSSPPQVQPNRERFAIEVLKSIVYGGLTETITSLGVVSSASASGSSTMNILALAVANLAGGLIILSQNLQDLKNNSDQEKDRYEELLGRRANFRMHILVAVLSYIFFGLIPPLVYAFSFYETGIKNYKLVSVFAVSLVCVVLLGMSKVYVRKPPNSCDSPKSYLKSAAYYTSIVVGSSGISYVVGDLMGEYIGKLGWFSLDQVTITSIFDGTKPEKYRFTSF